MFLALFLCLVACRSTLVSYLNDRFFFNLLALSWFRAFLLAFSLSDSVVTDFEGSNFLSSSSLPSSLSSSKSRTSFSSLTVTVAYLSSSIYSSVLSITGTSASKPFHSSSSPSSPESLTSAWAFLSSALTCSTCDSSSAFRCSRIYRTVSDVCVEFRHISGTNVLSLTYPVFSVLLDSRLLRCLLPCYFALVKSCKILLACARVEVKSLELFDFTLLHVRL